MAARWQYLTVSFPVGGFFRNAVDRDAMERKLTELAENEWELVSAVPISGSMNGATNSIFMIFKRPLT